MNRVARLALATIIGIGFILMFDCFDNEMNTFNGNLNFISWVMIIALMFLCWGIAWDED